MVYPIGSVLEGQEMFDRWREWLKVIGQQIDWLLVHRSTFRKFVSSGPKNADTGDCSDLIDLIRDGYIAFTGTTRPCNSTYQNPAFPLQPK
jgi:hypothetical protein